jgi:hypothetical protein
LLFEDEATFGLQVPIGRGISACGVKPIAQREQAFEYEHLYAAIEPLTGNTVTVAMSHSDTDCFNWFLKQVSAKYRNSICFMVLDCAGWHRAKNLDIPANIILWYLPPYSPELNPVERFWQELRRAQKNRVYRSIQNLARHLDEFMQSRTKRWVAQLCCFPYIVEALTVLAI